MRKFLIPIKPIFWLRHYLACLILSLPGVSLASSAEIIEYQTYAIENQGKFLNNSTTGRSGLSEEDLQSCNIYFSKADENSNYHITTFEGAFLSVTGTAEESENPLFHHHRKGANETFKVTIHGDHIRIGWGGKYIGVRNDQLTLISPDSLNYQDSVVNWTLKKSQQGTIDKERGKINFAALHGDIETLKSYRMRIRTNPIYSLALFSNGLTPIMSGIQSMDADTVEYLASFTRFFSLCNYNNEDEITYTIKLPESQFVEVTAQKKLAIINKLLSSHLNFYNKADVDGLYALHYAVLKAYPAIVRALVASEYHSNVGVKDRDGKTPLDYARTKLHSFEESNNEQMAGVYRDILSVLEPLDEPDSNESDSDESDTDESDIDRPETPLADILRNSREDNLEQSLQFLGKYHMRPDWVAYLIKNRLNLDLESFQPVEENSGTCLHSYIYTDPDDKKWFVKFRDKTESFKPEYDSLKVLYDTDQFVSRPIGLKYYPEINMIMKELVPGADTLRDYLKGRSSDRRSLNLNGAKLEKLKALFTKIFQAKLLLSDLNLGNIIYSDEWEDWYIIDSNGYCTTESAPLTALFYLQERYGRYSANRHKYMMNGTVEKNREYFQKQYQKFFKPIFIDYILSKDKNLFYKFFAESPVSVSVKDPESGKTYYLSRDHSGFLILKSSPDATGGFIFKNLNIAFDRQDCICLLDESGTTLSMRSKLPAFCGSQKPGNFAFLALKKEGPETFAIHVRAGQSFLKADFEQMEVVYDAVESENLTGAHKFTISLLSPPLESLNIPNKVIQAAKNVGPRKKNIKIFAHGLPVIVSGDRFAENFLKIDGKILTATKYRTDAMIFFFDPVSTEQGTIQYRILDASKRYLTFNHDGPEFTTKKEDADLFIVKEPKSSTLPFYGKYHLINMSKGKKYLTMRYDLDGKLELSDKTDTQVGNLGDEMLVGTWEAFNIRYIGEGFTFEDMF